MPPLIPCRPTVHSLSLLPSGVLPVPLPLCSCFSHPGQFTTRLPTGLGPPLKVVRDLGTLHSSAVLFPNCSLEHPCLRNDEHIWDFTANQVWETLHAPSAFWRFWGSLTHLRLVSSVVKEPVSPAFFYEGSSFYSTMVETQVAPELRVGGQPGNDVGWIFSL